MPRVLIPVCGCTPKGKTYNVRVWWLSKEQDMKAVLAVVLMLAMGSGSAAEALGQCSGGAVAVGKECGRIPWEGCCGKEGLFFCEGGELCRLSCKGNTQCGWNPQRLLYDCGIGLVPEPTGAYPEECLPEDQCYGVGYGGCCVGSLLYWCDDNRLRSLECQANDSKTACGVRPGGGADCVKPGSVVAAPRCSFAGPVPDADVVGGEEAWTLPDLTVPDVSIPKEAWVEPDWNIPLDQVTVPDMMAPDECVSLETRFRVVSTSCEGFASFFVVKQQGCVAVLVGLPSSAATDPAALVTRQGVSFPVTVSGLTRQCAGQFEEQRIEGNCFWGVDRCSFVFAPPGQEDPGGSGGNGGGSTNKPTSGGCSAGGPIGTGSGDALWWLLAGALLALVGRRIFPGGSVVRRMSALVTEE